MPAIALDRAVSEPFETKWLSWIGPWRLTTFMGYMEGGREDYDHPLLFGLRMSARPLDGLEISVERTAQWCGEGRSCNWDDFWNLWWGNDNAGENVDAEDEPGNQLAGWDIRWASPIGDWNYALYNQHTGETIDNKIPRPYRSMDIAGLETWGGGRATAVPGAPASSGPTRAAGAPRTARSSGTAPTTTASSTSRAIAPRGGRSATRWTATARCTGSLHPRRCAAGTLTALRYTRSTRAASCRILGNRGAGPRGLVERRRDLSAWPSRAGSRPASAATTRTANGRHRGGVAPCLRVVAPRVPIQSGP